MDSRPFTVYSMTANISNHPVFTQAQSIADICKPLEHFNINLFSHVHINHDGDATFLNNHPEFTQNYLSKKYYQADIYSATQNHFGELVLWDSLTCSGKSNSMLKDAVDFGHKQFLTLTEKDNTGTHFYYFATPSTSSTMSQVYLTNLDALKRFVHYFKIKVAESKELGVWNKMKISIDKKHDDILLADNQFALTDSNRKSFFEKIAVDNKLNNSLSYQQQNCLHLLAMGFSAREIADQLNLSRRTVESYLTHVRQVYGCRNSKELIALYYNHK